MNRRLILSTIGTSILTNAVPPADKSTTGRIFNETANLKEKDIDPQKRKIFDDLAEKVLRELPSFLNPDLSAEINVISKIHGKYGKAEQEMHILIHTDTYTGKKAAETLKEILSRSNLTVQIHSPVSLNTGSTADFAEGMDNLFKYMQGTLPGYRENGYEIFFNLAGGFKGFQGIMNTAGMFFADKIVYVFENQSAELIEIPRLPVKVNHEIFIENAGLFLMLAAGWNAPHEKLKKANLPESLYTALDGEAFLSYWGRLLWNQVKTEAVKKEPPEMEGLAYADRFISDFSSLASGREKLKFLEACARAAVLFIEGNYTTERLRNDKGLQYSRLQKYNIDHFRVSQSERITCRQEGKVLRLLRLGGHDINDDPV